MLVVFKRADIVFSNMPHQSGNQDPPFEIILCPFLVGFVFAEIEKYI